MKWKFDGWMASTSIEPPGYTLAYCVTNGEPEVVKPGDRCAYTGSYLGTLLVVIRDVDRNDPAAKQAAIAEVKRVCEAHATPK